jgi:hypothetical protein
MKTQVCSNSGLLERWVSGLNQQFAKLRYWATGTGGSNPPLSATKPRQLQRRFNIFASIRMLRYFDRSTFTVEIWSDSSTG